MISLFTRRGFSEVRSGDTSWVAMGDDGVGVCEMDSDIGGEGCTREKNWRLGTGGGNTGGTSGMVIRNGNWDS